MNESQVDQHKPQIPWRRSVGGLNDNSASVYPHRSRQSITNGLCSTFTNAENEDIMNGSNSCPLQVNVFNNNNEQEHQDHDDMGIPLCGVKKPVLGGLYTEASRCLRVAHGVVITPAQLEQVINLLNFRPHRLVECGLVGLASKNQSQRDLSGSGMDVADDDHLDPPTVTPEGSRDSTEASSADGMTSGDEGPPYYRHGESPTHAALEANGVHLRPRDVKPLLKAIGTGPRRFVCLGLVSPTGTRRGGRRFYGGIGRGLCRKHKGAACLGPPFHNLYFYPAMYSVACENGTDWKDDPHSDVFLPRHWKYMHHSVCTNDRRRIVEGTRRTGAMEAGGLVTDQDNPEEGNAWRQWFDSTPTLNFPRGYY